jgi:hypothetical protein
LEKKPDFRIKILACCCTQHAATRTVLTTALQCLQLCVVPVEAIARMASELPNEGTIDPVNEDDKPVASGPPAEAFSLSTDAGEDSARLFIATR